MTNKKNKNRLTYGHGRRRPFEIDSITSSFAISQNGRSPYVITSQHKIPKLQTSDAFVNFLCFIASGAVHLIAILPPYKEE